MARKKSKFDIFNGNVRNPGEFILIYSLIGLICLATLIGFAICSAPKSPEKLQYTSVQFTKYEIDDGKLLLYAEGSEWYYCVPAYQETMTNPSDFLQQCKAGTVFQVGYEDYPKADPAYFGLERISDENGTVYLTMEAIHEHRWGDAPKFYGIFGAITAICFLFIILSIYVGRHPERFSRRTVRLFFKDGYLQSGKK